MPVRALDALERVRDVLARVDGLFELLVVDAGLQDLIAAGAHNAQIRKHARERFFKTMVDDALEKIAAGLTTVDELVRVIPYRHIVATRDERQG